MSAVNNGPSASAQVNQAPGLPATWADKTGTALIKPDGTSASISGSSAANVRQTYVIRDGQDGITAGTVDDATAAQNLIALQAIVDAADANTANIEMDTITVEIAGGPLIFRNSCSGVTWNSSTFATLRQRTDNVGILQLGDAANTCQNLAFEGINLHYLNDQSANTSANALTIYNQWKAKIGRIQISNTITNSRSYRGIYFPQGQAVFSCDFYDWFVFQSAFSLLHIANFGTGNAYTNIYLSGVGSNGSAQVVSNPFLWQIGSGSQMHDSVFDQMNIEWCNSNTLMRVNNVRGAVWDSLHIEQNILSGANASMINNVISNLQINSLLLLDNRIQAANASDYPSVHKGFNNGRTTVKNFCWVNNSASYIDRSFYMHLQSDTDGFNSSPSSFDLDSWRLVEGSGTVIRDNMIPDRTFGGTDKYGGSWPALNTDSGNHMYLGGGMSRIQGGTIRPVSNVDTTVYGQSITGSPIILAPNNSTGAIRLSNFMGPTSSRWAAAAVPDNTTVCIYRAGTTVGAIPVQRNDGTTIATLPDAAASAQYNFAKVSGQWVQV